MATLPDGSVLVTHRDDGTVSRVRQDGSVVVLGTVDGVVPGGEGGLLGLAVPPGERPRAIYVYYTAAQDNRVARLSFDGRAITGQQVILSGIPKGPIHNGGRIKFGPDGFLYVGTGETGDGQLAQEPTSLGGKILRVTTDGRPAPGNPDPGSAIWTTGHRNVQGFDWDADGRMWATEFGQSDADELNLVEAGRNYGWPICEGACDEPGMTNPRLVWSPTAIASPSGMAIAGGSVWVASLRGEVLWQVPLNGTEAGDPISRFEGRYGRLRDVIVGPDGKVWVATSNTDGRGDARPGDDRIVAFSVSGD